jgi:hypothetical protein
VKNNLAQMTVGLTAEEFAALEQAFVQTRFSELTAEDAAEMKRALHGVTSERGNVNSKRVQTRSQAQADL